MNIETHLTSLPLSKQLHEAGFVRESCFVWEVVIDDYDVEPVVVKSHPDNKNQKGSYGEGGDYEVVYYPAYLETELNTELRKVVINTLLDNVTDELRELVSKVESLWNNPNLLEDKGKLLLYLIQHQLIEV